jgi:yecA family protein
VTGNAIDYRGLNDLVARSGSPLVLAELHGGLAGVMCAGGSDPARRWLEDVLDDCAADANTLAELAGELEQLHEATWEALNGMSLEFSPLLPDERYAVDERAAALAHWCLGFLAGLVIGGLDLSSNQVNLAPELAELVADFAEISKAGADDEEIENADNSEESLSELTEFVRVGVQFIFEELTPESAEPGRRVLH